MRQQMGIVQLETALAFSPLVIMTLPFQWGLPALQNPDYVTDIQLWRDHLCV